MGSLADRGASDGVRPLSCIFIVFCIFIFFSYRLAWEALKKSINGLINKVNSPNIAIIVRELFAENIVRGRGLLCQSIMQAQVDILPKE